MNQKNNMGYQKTHEKIKNCFQEMLDTDEPPKITIQNLCKEADINRSTFYAHFQDIFDLSNQVSDDLNNELLQTIDQNSNGHKLTYQECLFSMLEHFKKYRHMYLFFLRDILSDTNSVYTTRDLRMLHEYFLTKIFRYYNISEALGGYYYAYTQTGFFAVVRIWLENNCPESPEVLGRIILDLQPPTPEGEDIMSVFMKANGQAHSSGEDTQ